MLEAEIGKAKWGKLLSMSKIIDLFGKINFEEFIRVILFDDSIKLIHILNNKLINKISIELREKTKIFEYLENNSSIPMDVIISSNTMSCRSVSVNKLKEKDIHTLATNILVGKKESINLVCYEKKMSYRNGAVSLCDMKLSPVISIILEEILNIGNPVSSFLGWPFWIVSSYFELYPSDKNKFEASLFIIETEKIWEIIAIHNEKYICYRHGNLENFNKKIETENVIKFTNQMFNIDPNDMVIYSINNKTISTFTKNSHVRMKAISKSGEICIANKTQNINFILKIACSIVFLGLFINTIFDVIKIFHYDNRIQESRDTIDSIDPEIVNEIAFWGSLDDYGYMDRVDFKSKLKEKTKNSKQKLQNASIKIDEKTKQIVMNTIYDNE